MNSGEQRGDPFSSSDEAFFQAGVHAEQEASSERPVTLDAADVAAHVSPRTSARDARRERLLRVVKSTLGALSLLAVVGLARYALRPGIASDQPAPTATHAVATNAQVGTASEAPLVEVAAAIAASPDEDSAWDNAPMCEVAASSEQATPSVAEHATAKPSPRPPTHHGATPAHRRAKVPVSKAALLRAIRAS